MSLGAASPKYGEKWYVESTFPTKACSRTGYRLRKDLPLVKMGSALSYFVGEEQPGPVDAVSDGLVLSSGPVRLSAEDSADDTEKYYDAASSFNNNNRRVDNVVKASRAQSQESTSAPVATEAAVSDAGESASGLETVSRERQPSLGHCPGRQSATSGGQHVRGADCDGTAGVSDTRDKKGSRMSTLASTEKRIKDGVHGANRSSNSMLPRRTVSFENPSRRRQRIGEATENGANIVPGCSRGTKRNEPLKSNRVDLTASAALTLPQDRRLGSAPRTIGTDELANILCSIETVSLSTNNATPSTASPKQQEPKANNLAQELKSAIEARVRRSSSFKNHQLPPSNYGHRRTSSLTRLDAAIDAEPSREDETSGTPSRTHDRRARLQNLERKREQILCEVRGGNGDVISVKEDLYTDDSRQF